MKKTNMHKPLRAPHSGTPVTREEILNVLANEGYSADQRKGWLKKVLTNLTAQEADVPDMNQRRLIEEVKEILDEQQNGGPLSDDVL